MGDIFKGVISKEKEKSQYTIPHDLDTLLEIHRGMVRFEKENGFPPGITQLAHYLGINPRKAHRYMHHLKDVGVINFRDRAMKDTGMEILVKGDIEPVVRKLYGYEGYVVVVGDDPRHPGRRSRTFRRIVLVGSGRNIRAKARTKHHRHWLAGWNPAAVADGEEFWLKDYAVGDIAKGGKNEQGQPDD